MAPIALDCMLYMISGTIGRVVLLSDTCLEIFIDISSTPV